MLSDNTQKDCVIINIKVFNKISMFNVYLVFLQTNILAAVQDAKYISIVNCNVYFYQ